MRVRTITFHEWLDVAYLPFDDYLRVHVTFKCNSIMTVNHYFLSYLN